MLYQSVLSPMFLSPDAVRLGRFVLNIDEPLQDYHDPRGELTPNNRTEQVQEQLDCTLETTSNTSFATKLIKLLSASRSKVTNSTSQVTAGTVHIYKLKNSGAWYEDAIKDPETRKWIEKAAKAGDDVFLTVGYNSMTEVRVVDEAMATTNTSFQAEAPVGELLPAAGLLPMGDAANLTLQGQAQHGYDMYEKYNLKDEQVCAVQYRKVQLGWLFSSKVDNSSLEKGNRWRTKGILRGEGGAVAEDVLEAKLDDTLELGGLYEPNVIQDGEGKEEVFWTKLPKNDESE